MAVVAMVAAADTWGAVVASAVEVVASAVAEERPISAALAWGERDMVVSAAEPWRRHAVSAG
jgi:hypothetical protein